MSTEYSGKYGQVDLGASLYYNANQWDMSIAAENEQYGLFNGSGWKKGIAGQLSGSGTISGKQDFAKPINGVAMPGDTVTLKLYETTTASGAASARYWTVTAIITDLSPTVDGDTGMAVGWTMSWISSGLITQPS